MGNALNRLFAHTYDVSEDDAEFILELAQMDSLEPEPELFVALATSPGGRPADDSPLGTPGGKQNWVDKAGGLPKYIRMIAHALVRKGMSKDHAIATAVNRVKRLAATSTNPKVKAAAAAAVAEWSAKKARE